jgi:ganglioside-induced differentiation-associated protein 2
LIFPVLSCPLLSPSSSSSDLVRLQVDAIVNTTNERLSDRSGVSGRVFKGAGPELVPELQRCEGCHTGEAVITKGYDLPASYIIHTVGPRFSVKYQTAAENALHGCYRRSLEIASEHGLDSVAFPLVNTERKGYPKEAAAHIAIRTVRRFLEKYDNAAVSTVVFCMDKDEDVEVYSQVLPLYFPRNKAEEIRAKSLLPADTGNELGESVIAERKIRISAMPGMGGDDDDDDAAGASYSSSYVGSSGAGTGTGTGAGANAVSASSSVAYYQPDLPDTKNTAVDPDIATMQDNPDDTREHYAGHASKEDMERARRYERCLQRAQNEDFADIEAYGFMYRSGVDFMNRPVVVFVCNRFPASLFSPERLQLFLIKFLHPIADNDYTILYCHTNIQSENKPAFKWMRETYDMLPRKFKKNLKSLYIVHPSFWVKLVMLFVSPFVSKKFWRKLKKVDRLFDVYQEIDAGVLKVPEDIIEYDRQQNAADYEAEFGRGAAPQHGDVNDEL